MDFQQSLLSGTLHRRYQRFLAEIELTSGELITAHCPNTGSMKGLVAAGTKVYISKSNNPKRKLSYTLELIDIGTSLVGIHTGRANGIVKEAIAKEKVSELLGYEIIRQEVPYGKNSRIDLLLENPAAQQHCYVEVKNVTLREENNALFPDAVTVRGAKHLDELAKMCTKNCRSVMFYLVQREDCDYFSPANHIDPVYGEKLQFAIVQGVEVIAYSCQLTPQAIYINKPLPIRL
ncbi:DNA/RNA nuclease SfsA [Candidatus Nitrosacidococcus tergens]|uniref:Sugar fermentation stimulation protein homolog n=1 Tax=Candidatus Nitrosacidococcus tergens TaxID=553981 RepID=A0A7G1Q8M8_9GAMM|nr:DNA/RNA nuclease SfsA [Candidatus Nitrosacidococcus tergens]CAB1275134.1 Sugar fermentation stimulation protein homolog [Candidatus Nitrosacidococcus tergens]